jgi:RNA polymerase sigma factor (sigma-70 family)
MILANLRLVLKIARQFRSNGVTVDDLVQEGIPGLIRALELYDPDTHSTRFASYAHYWIRQSIQRALAANCSLIRLPDYIFRLHSRFNRLMSRLRSEKNETADPDDASPEEIASRLGIAVQTLGLLRRSKMEQTTIRIFDDDGREHSLEEMVPDHYDPEREKEKAAQIDVIHRALDALPPFDNWLIRRRFNLPESLGEAEHGASSTEEEPGLRPSPGPGSSLNAISQLLGVTRKRVREAEEAAIERLRQILAATGLQIGPD